MATRDGLETTGRDRAPPGAVRRIERATVLAETWGIVLDVERTGGGEHVLHVLIERLEVRQIGRTEFVGAAGRRRGGRCELVEIGTLATRAATGDRRGRVRR